MEDLELDKDSLKKQVKELTEKISSVATKPNVHSTVTLRKNTTKNSNLAEEKVKVKYIIVFLWHYG